MKLTISHEIFEAVSLRDPVKGCSLSGQSLCAAADLLNKKTSYAAAALHSGLFSDGLMDFSLNNY